MKNNIKVERAVHNITQAKFSRFEAVRLLDSLDVELVD